MVGRELCVAPLIWLNSVFAHMEKIIHHPFAKDSGWPQVFGVSLSENELSGMLPTRYIQITRTDVYNLCFIHCDLDLKDMVVEGKTIWENAWIIPAFWQLLSFQLLGIIMFSLGSIPKLNQVTPYPRRLSKQQGVYEFVPSLSSCRYVFSGSSGDTSGEFEEDDYTLTLIKPSPIPSQEVKNISNKIFTS